MWAYRGFFNCDSKTASADSKIDLPLGTRVEQATDVSIGDIGCTEFEVAEIPPADFGNQVDGRGHLPHGLEIVLQVSIFIELLLTVRLLVQPADAAFESQTSVGLKPKASMAIYDLILSTLPLTTTGNPKLVISRGNISWQA